MANSVNNFKIFDESLDNLLSVSDYGNHSQRVSGFDTDEEIPSKLFNSVLRQNTLLTYCLVDYMKNYVDDTTIEHDMLPSTLSTFISNFFNTLKDVKPSDLETTGMNLGEMLYVGYVLGENKVTGLTPPNHDGETYIVSYEYNTGAEAMLPFVKKLTFETFDNNSFSNVSVGMYQSYIDLGTLYSDKDDLVAEIELEETYSGSRYVSTYNIPLKRLQAISYHQINASETTIVGSNLIVIKALHSDIYIFMGLSNSHGDTYSATIGQYLRFLTTDANVLGCNINITIKERRF